MLRSHLRHMARQVAQLEASARPPAASLGWDLEEQAQMCRSLLAACARGDVERTPEGYVAITDSSREGERFEVEPGRWDRRCAITPEMIAWICYVAKLLTYFFQETDRYFPVYEGIANQQNPQFVEAVYRHYGRRLFA
jgi:hypothetical protein